VTAAERMTEEEFADSRERHARWSAIATLVFCSTWSIAGCVYYAAAYGAGDLPTMLITATLSLVLLLGIHLRASTHAAVEQGRAVPSARAATTVGGVLLVGMALVGNFAVLHSLAIAKALNPVAAVLTPLALDVGVITATWTLFALRPKLVRSRRSAAPAAPAKPRPAAAPTAAAPTAAAPTTSTGAAPTTSVAAAPAAAPAASAASAPVIAAAASPVQHDRAAAIAASGVTAKSVDDVAAVLQLLDAGASDRGVHAETGVDARTVAKIRKAAAEPEPTRTLTTV
jgi:hypothetical protein